MLLSVVGKAPLAPRWPQGFAWKRIVAEVLRTSVHAQYPRVVISGGCRCPQPSTTAERQGTRATQFHRDSSRRLDRGVLLRVGKPLPGPSSALDAQSHVQYNTPSAGQELLLTLPKAWPVLFPPRLVNFNFPDRLPTIFLIFSLAPKVRSPPNTTQHNTTHKSTGRKEPPSTAPASWQPTGDILRTYPKTNRT